MKKKTLGMMISSLRKERGMTQLDLAEKMGVTDKAVSKWERDLSCPDVNTIPKLAEVFSISVDELMQVKAESQGEDKKNITSMIHMIMKAVALARRWSCCSFCFERVGYQFRNGYARNRVSLSCYYFTF